MTFIPFTICCKARDLGMALAAVAGMHRETPDFTDEVDVTEVSDDGRIIPCPDCLGSGTVMSTTWDSPWHEKVVTCGTCDGAGEIEERV